MLYPFCSLNFFLRLVAWVCLRNPKECPSTLLRLFFRTFATWKWPKPVTLMPIQSEPPNGVPPMTVWNPNINPRDARHIMPIVTPAYPSSKSRSISFSPAMLYTDKHLTVRDLSASELNVQCWASAAPTFPRRNGPGSLAFREARG
jgi:poly(A) polymerase Pap1